MSGGGKGRTGVRRRFLAPEVVQTSAMDCGPASLKCLLEGLDVPVSYGRLREACQTTVDGTSVDTLEDVARELGLDAEQVVIPVDHVLLPEAAALPALAVVRLPSGFTHFVVIWRRHGPWVQIMDPASGRRFVRGRDLERDLHVHAQPVPATAFRQWADEPEMRDALARRLAALGAPEGGWQLVEEAAADASAVGFASLDAAARMVESLARAGAVERGDGAVRMLRALCEQARRDAGRATEAIPATYWTAAPLPGMPGADPAILLRGAVLLRVKRSRAISPDAVDSPELQGALRERPEAPLAELLRLVRRGGWISPATLLLATVVAAVAGVLEMVVMRALLDVTPLGLLSQRMAAIGLVVLATLVVLAFELTMAAESHRLGRALELRLRQAFLAKLPRLPDRYLQSRPTSDMAARSHGIHALRQLPALAARLLRTIVAALATAAAILWIDPGAGLAVIVLLLLVALAPLLLHVPLRDHDMRLRIHAGALGRFYLDALLGLSPIRTHGAERSVRREHEGLLSEWMRAGRAGLEAFLAFDALQGLLTVAVVILMVSGYLERGGEPGGVLLLAYFGLLLATLGREVSMYLRQYPAHRNTLLRLLEPLGALEDGTASAGDQAAADAAPAPGRGTVIDLERVSVVAGGHPILRDVSVRIGAGEHVAIVGPSGAGKSSLVGLMLGFHRPAGGRLTADGAELRGAALASLRRATAWVDPAAQLWNRTLLENLLYGSDGMRGSPGDVLARADLLDVLGSLPDGLQTSLGEGGGLLSGGEGQRVRFGRALLRRQARLVILDEPFRGLEGARRRELMARARSHWERATLLCISHDVRDTLAFPRVLVVEGGSIVEDGSPAELAGREGSRFRAMLDAAAGVWRRPRWRGLTVDEGRVREVGLS